MIFALKCLGSLDATGFLVHYIIEYHGSDILKCNLILLFSSFAFFASLQSIAIFAIDRLIFLLFALNFSSTAFPLVIFKSLGTSAD